MQVTGILKAKFDTQKVSDRFQKREFVLTTEANTPYPQHVSFQVTQDKCTILDQYREGEELKIQFNLRGREWSGPQGIKYFNTLEAWHVERASDNNQDSTATVTPAGADKTSTTKAPTFTNSNEDNDDLPF